MKKHHLQLILSVVLLLCLVSDHHGQTVQWAKKGISEGFENGNAVVVDDSGNVYVTGQFEFTSVFDNVTLYSYGQHDMMVAKYGNDGKLRWIRQAGGPGGDIGNGIGIDALHNVYVTGEIEDTVKFGSITKRSLGGNDGFLAKYDVNGKIVWVKDFGTASGSEKGRAIAVSPSGDVYITGNFSTSTDFGNITLTSNGGNDIFIVKYDTDGDVIWAKKAGGPSQDRGYGIVIDASENVYITGTFTQSATFKNTTITNPANNSSFVAKYNSSGQFQWVNESGACCDTTKSNGIALDDNGNIYIAGYFMDETRFDSYRFNSRGVSDIFIVKYDPSGDVIWAKQAGGIEEDGAYGLVVDNLNHLLYVTGLVREQGNFDNIPYGVRGYKDIFLAAYNLDGDAVWVQTYGGNYRDLGSAVTVDNQGNIYTTGLFNDVAYFGPYTLTGYPNQPWADFYVDKISPATAQSPTVNSSNLSVTTVNCSDLDIYFTSGNGTRRIIVAHEGTPVNAIPVNGNSYSGNSIYGSGTNLGNNNYVVYNGTGNNVTLTNLTPGVMYYFSIFEYNGIGLTSNFFTNNPTTGNALTVIFPITITSIQNIICEGDSLVLFASNASSYSWSPLNNLTILSDTSVIVKPQITTTYTVSGITSEGCFAESNITIIVNPSPAVSFQPLNGLCLNNSPINLTGGLPAGGTYSGPGVSGSQFIPMSVGSGIYLLNYKYSDSNGCVNTAQSSIRVHSIPGVILTSIPSLCDNASPVLLNNGSPVGGIYSGPGVSGGIFDPAIGHGAHQITYSYTNTNGCTGAASNFIVVKMSPSVNLGNDLITCAGNSTMLNAGPGFNLYSWSTGETSSSIVIDSSGIGIGTKNISVQVTNNSGCTEIDSISITFDLCAGLNTISSELKNISISPNPFYSEFTLTTDKIVSICIYDICGKLLYKRENAFGKITIAENLKAGVYFVEVMSGVNRKIFQVLKSGL